VRGKKGQVVGLRRGRGLGNRKARGPESEKGQRHCHCPINVCLGGTERTEDVGKKGGKTEGGQIGGGRKTLRKLRLRGDKPYLEG